MISQALGHILKEGGNNDMERTGKWDKRPHGIPKVKQARPLDIIKISSLFKER